MHVGRSLRTQSCCVLLLWGVAAEDISESLHRTQFLVEEFSCLGLTGTVDDCGPSSRADTSSNVKKVLELVLMQCTVQLLSRTGHFRFAVIKLN